ncbi:MAG TPA: zinc ABC transporter substrate-binding protein, partial [Terrimesophilobacter sp.]|nr:zinc ABC transporter substrate-binding protein [Terrimesophilobacter sp.]
EHADNDDDHAADDHGHVHSDLGPDFNEHVWYHLETAKGLASALAAALSDLDPAGATTYSSNSDVFSLEVDALIERAHELEHELGHLHVVLTEPAPQYLAELLGAHNITPEAFTSAVEAGFDVPANALLEVLRLVESGDADLVLWNEQTSGPQIERVVAAARDAGVPVVTVSETLPPGTDYLSWMGSNLDAIAGVLSP